MSIKNGFHFNDLVNNYYLDTEGNKYPEYVCLCAAHEPSECCCDCTNWNSTSWIEDDYDN